MPQSADNTSFVRITTAVALLFAWATPARADWLLIAYMGTSSTASNTVNIEPASGGTLEVGSIAYDARAFTSPVYYGGRATYFLPAVPWLGLGGEWTHNKATADVNQSVTAGMPQPRVRRADPEGIATG